MNTLHALACCAALFALPVAVVWPLSPTTGTTEEAS